MGVFRGVFSGFRGFRGFRSCGAKYGLRALKVLRAFGGRWARHGLTTQDFGVGDWGDPRWLRV